MKEVKIAACQMESEPLNLSKNIEKAKEYIKKAINQKVNVVCFPELCLSGYHLNHKEIYPVSIPKNADEIKEFQQIARDDKMVIILPFSERSEIPGQIYNSTIVIDNSGSVAGIHRKFYLWGEEKLCFRKGTKFQNYSINMVNIGVNICYDAEYPEPPRICAMKGAKLLFVPSVWSFEGEPRWDIQLPARALDNLYYVIGVNTIGLKACGKSKFVSPMGEVLGISPRKEEDMLVKTIDLEEVERARGELPYIKDIEEGLFIDHNLVNYPSLK